MNANGMRWDIHPKRKRLVGERLALLARGHIYGQDVLCDAPRMQDAIFCGREAAVRFVSAEGLYVQGDVINGLLVNGVPCQASVRLDMLVIPLPEGDHWRIEYACQPYYEANLYNATHLPAFPFAIEMDRRTKT